MPKLPWSGFVRIASVEPCEVEVGSQRFRATTWDISVKGVYLVLDPAPAVGETVRISLRLPGTDEPIHATGRVAWHNPPSKQKGVASKVVDLPPGCGVEFLTIAEEDLRRIQAHVETSAGAEPVG